MKQIRPNANPPILIMVYFRFLVIFLKAIRMFNLSMAKKF
jgi:hypothetical protein